MTRRLLALGLVVSQCFGSALAQPDTKVAPNDSSLVTEVEQTASEVTRSETPRSSVMSAELYGLSADEWRDYQTLMKGPQGQWSRDLHPVFVLGMEARTDAERQRHAERYAAVVFVRAQKVAAFAEAYQVAYQRRYGHLTEALLAQSDAKRPLSSADRLVLFAAANCAACDAKLEELRFALERGDAAALDIYLTDMPDDDAIRVWAMQRRIPTDDVKAARITLNHAGDKLSELGFAAADLPVVLKESPPAVPALSLSELLGAMP